MFYPIVVDARLLLFVWLVASAMSIIGMLALWAGLSRRHWFVGAATLAAVIGLLAVVPAFDLMLVFLVQSLIVMLALRLARMVGWPAAVAMYYGRGNRWRRQIKLKDLFLLVLAAGGLMFFIIHVPDSVRATARDYLLCGAGAGLASLAAATAVFVRWPIAIRLFVLVSAPLAAALLPTATALDDSDPLRETLLGWAGYPEWLWCAVLPLSSAIIAVGLVIARHSREIQTLAPPLSDLPSQSIWRARTCLAVFLASVLAMPAVAYWQMIHVPPAPNDPMPEPNGHQTLRRIGAELEDVIAPNINSATTVQLKQFVADHQAQLAAIRQALDHEWRATVSYEPGEWEAPELSVLRILRDLFMAEAQLEERSGDYGAAADTCATMVRLGEASKRGGLFIDWLVGNAVSGSGVDELARLRAVLVPKECHSIVEQLDAVAERSEPLADVAKRERIWQQRAEGWRARIAFLQSPLPSPAYQEIEQRYAARLRLLTCDLALRDYQNDRHALPDRLEELAPLYLPSVPEDPFTGAPLMYRRAESGFLLYSVGPDRIDDGGRPAAGNLPATGEDLMLPVGLAPPANSQP